MPPLCPLPRRCGGFGTAEAAEAAQDYTLPPGRAAALAEGTKRAALIYAEDLRQRLWGE